MRESGGKTAALQNFLWAPADGILPVGECFTANKVRVSVFSRTAIHAPGGWALIENLPNVLTGDRVTVGLTSTYLLPHRKKHRSSLHGVCVLLRTLGGGLSLEAEATVYG